MGDSFLALFVAVRRQLWHRRMKRRCSEWHRENRTTCTWSFHRGRSISTVPLKQFKSVCETCWARRHILSLQFMVIITTLILRGKQKEMYDDEKETDVQKTFVIGRGHRYEKARSLRMANDGCTSSFEQQRQVLIISASAVCKIDPIRRAVHHQLLRKQRGYAETQNLSPNLSQLRSRVIEATQSSFRLRWGRARPLK